MVPGQVYPWQKDIFDRLRQNLQESRLAHAYQLNGRAYLGKTDFALAFAAALLCENPEKGFAEQIACGSCAACELLKAGSHADLRVVLPEESGQIKIDTVRDLLAWSSQTSQRGGYKIVVISPAEAMNTAAANAFLKCLEEPPEKSLFLLVTHKAGNLPATLRSRCQRLDFKLPERDEALEWLRKSDALSGLEESPEMLLEMAQGLPLKIVRLYTAEFLANRQALMGYLARLASGEDEPLRVADALKEVDMGELLLLWTDFVSACVRPCNQPVADKANTGPADLALYQPENSERQKVASLLGTDRLFEFYDTLINALKVVNGRSNPNRLLLLESLLIDWSGRSDTSSVR